MLLFVSFCLFSKQLNDNFVLSRHIVTTRFSLDLF